MKLENIYIDLSKCSEEELKNIYTILGDTLKFISPSIVFNFPIMHYHEGMWIRTNFFQDKAKEDSFLEDKTEITYPEFIKLFEGETCPKCRTKDFENCHSIRCPMRDEKLFEGGEGETFTDKIQKLQADKAELLEALEKAKNEMIQCLKFLQVEGYEYLEFENLEEIKSLIQKHKQ